MALFTRTGTEFTGTVEHDDNGRPVRLVAVACDRCVVINGQRLWIMGIENGAPYSKTGFDCWTCGNSGVRGERKERLFTAEQLVRLNKAAATREAKAAAAANKAREERLAAETAFRAEHADFISKLECLGGTEFWDDFRSSFLSRMAAPTERQIAVVEGEIAKRAANAASGHFGAIGDRVTLTITVERIIVLQHPVFGTNFITIARCDNGNIISYKGKTDIGREGETLTITATVKGHEVYNGTRQTLIQRPKVLETA
jgi:hypothetical protein